MEERREGRRCQLDRLSPSASAKVERTGTIQVGLEESGELRKKEGHLKEEEEEHHTTVAAEEAAAGGSHPVEEEPSWEDCLRWRPSC
jgi:hypothetical protein